jgi:hypothetical protein
MKKILLVSMLAFMFGCAENDKTVTAFENQVKELKQELANVYKPGFGTIMGNIQTHHSKLWFAGEGENWELAEFEIHEIIEELEDIEKYQKNRVENEKMFMIEPALDSISKVIKNKKLTQFEDSYKLLTESCNACHEETKYEFIKITVPKVIPCVNQEFNLN